jgi:ribosomal protein L18
MKALEKFVETKDHTDKKKILSGAAAVGAGSALSASENGATKIIWDSLKKGKMGSFDNMKRVAQLGKGMRYAGLSTAVLGAGTIGSELIKKRPAQKR